MPYINCVVTKEMSEGDKERMKIHLGDLVSLLPGKSEEWLFVGFNDKQTLYFRGLKQESAAVIEVKLVGSQEIKTKDKFTSRVSTIFEDELEIPKENIYVIFQEVADGNWGWNGELF